MPIAYYIWAIFTQHSVIVVDTGFTRNQAIRRGREFLSCPSEILPSLGVMAEDVNDVVLTHLHYDHVGNHKLFPNARMHLQTSELAYATGRYMRFAACAEAYDVENIAEIVREQYKGRLVMHNGSARIVPGVELHLIGGHTPGLQVVVVSTRRGQLVIASDAAHFYENLEASRPFPIVFNVGEMLDGFETVKKFAGSDACVIPGHDPIVMERFPAVPVTGLGRAVRLD